MLSACLNRLLPTGRWVTTYPEMEYFEFHLPTSPLFIKRDIRNAFPFATHLVTTYTIPIGRSLWVMGPKPGRHQKYQQILMEIDSWDLAEFHEI